MLILCCHQTPNPYPDVLDDVHYIPANPSISTVANPELSNDIQLMFSRVNTYGTDMLRSEFIMEEQGLGALPGALPSTGSMLLFNSNINPYKNYQALDNLVSTGR
jgi:hypothetical protein